MSKIVHAIHCCNIGGAEIFVKNIVLKMKEVNPNNDYEIWAIYSSKDLYNNDKKAIEYEKKYIEELEKENIKVEILSKGNGINGRIKLNRKIKELYKKSLPDVINCHLETVTFHIVSALCLRKVKIYETIHTSLIKNKKIHKYFLNLKLKKYVAISKKIAKIIKESINCKKDKIELIYNGINVEKFDINRRFEDKKNIEIIAVGRIIEIKNHILLIKAFERMKKSREKELKNYNVSLKIYGDGIVKKSLEEYINKNNIKNCKMVGATDNVPAALQKADIYVLPSNIEGFSISLIEAKTSGIAIICTDVGGNKEIISDNKTGFIINKEDEEELSEKLYELTKNYKIREKFYNNCKLEKDDFSIDMCAKKYLEMYKKVN